VTTGTTEHDLPVLLPPLQWNSALILGLTPAEPKTNARTTKAHTCRSTSAWECHLLAWSDRILSITDLLLAIV